MSVEDIVLEAEEQIIEDCYKSQYNFCEVETIVDRNTSADHWKNTSKKIKNDVENGPSFGAFSSEIINGRRRVLDERDS